MKLFKKNEVTFAVVLIVIYVVGSSVMQRVSDSLGSQFLAEMVFCLIMSGILFIFIRKNELSGYLGLKKPELPSKKMLYYIPLMLIACITAFFGIGTEYSAGEAVRRTVMMLCVGFLEEVIFRGFLFRGIAKKNVKRAVIISSLTFGIGHFVNLLNGSKPLENTLQVIYAVAVGFLLVFIFMRTGSIIPCIAFHSLNNCLTAFTTGELLTSRLGETAATVVIVMIQLAIAGAYLLYVVRQPKKELDVSGNL